MAFGIAEIRDMEVVQEAFDAIPDIILVISPDYKIMLANRAFCHHYGLTDEDVIGIPYYRIVHGHDIPAENCSCTKALASTIYEEAEITRFNTIFATSATPIFEDGRIGAIVHTLRDITIIREGARQKAINETLGAVCHDMTQPMQIISANISLLLNGTDALPAEVQNRLSIIDKSITDMGALTHQMQQIGRSGTAASIEYTGNDRILDLHEGNSTAPS
ncbi:MAG: PAS domain-containing protein [Candidatus Marinimicrobia bacterium]|nr:PAS domain-containing protein [Candidatus Neomarinimicrobiota bacterium]